MATKYPVRHEAHQLSEESENFFRRQIPRQWICEKPEHDYGVDLRIGLTDGDQLTGRGLLVQLKAKRIAPLGETIAVRLKVRTYNLLRDQLDVAILVVYVSSEQEAYWIFVRDISVPNQIKETFTVRVPRTNRLSHHPWETLTALVSTVHARKLQAFETNNRPG